MKKFAILGFTIATALFVRGTIAQAPAGAAPAPAKDQTWLKQLVGEWDVTLKLGAQAGQPAAESPGTDSVRALGDHWVISELKTSMMGSPFDGIFSLGYDADKKSFSGTWIDSMGGYLWIYKASLNDAGDTMTLESEGPSMQDPGKMAKYKEVMQITGKDSRMFTSSFQGEGGAWTKMLTIEYKRKK